MSSTTAENPAVLSLDIEEEQAPQGRSMAFKILIGLSIVGVAALVAVGIAVGVTAMTALSPTATSPVAFYASEATRFSAADTLTSKLNSPYVVTRRRAKFALAEFMEALRQGTSEFNFVLPGLEQPLVMETTSWKDTQHLNSFKWLGHVKGSFETAFITLQKGRVVGDVRHHNLRWLIAGSADDCVIVEFDHTGATNAASIPPNIGVNKDYTKVHSNLTSPMGRSQKNQIAKATKNVYDTMTIMLVFNRDGCNQLVTDRIALIEGQITAGWQVMGLPDPEIVWYCKRYHTSSINSEGDIAIDQTDPILKSLQTNYNVALRRAELGADLVMGVGSYTATTSKAGIAYAEVFAEGGYMWVDVAPRPGYTAVHEIGHCMGMKHNRNVKENGQCPASDTSKCNYGGRGMYSVTNNNDGSQLNIQLVSIMDYGPGGSCAPDNTGTYAYVPVYSGHSLLWSAGAGYPVGNIQVGSSPSVGCVGGSNYNRIYAEYFYNVIANSYPTIASTCTHSDGCRTTVPYPTFSSSFSNGMYPLKASHNLHNTVWRIKNKGNGKCLHAGSSTTVKMNSCSTSNRQKWTLGEWNNNRLFGMHGDPLGYEEDLADPTTWVQRYTFKNKQYSSKWLGSKGDSGANLVSSVPGEDDTDFGGSSLRIYFHDSIGAGIIVNPYYLSLDCDSSSVWFDRNKGDNSQRWIFEAV